MTAHSAGLYLAPLKKDAIERVVAREWRREFPYAIEPPPWRVIGGHGEYSAVLSLSEGTEGADWHFAEILSKLAQGKTLYSLWFDPERRQIIEWVNGSRVSAREGDPFEIAASAEVNLAGTLSADETEPVLREPSDSRSAALVENASLGDVRQALGEMVNEAWLHVTRSDAGVLVTSDDGHLGTQAWDIAEALPEAIVYYVQRQIEPPLFTVSVFQGPNEIGWLSVPPMDDEANLLPDIKGARTPEGIMRALGIPSEAFGDV